ncbi:hypothetical protein BJY04DRAFT_228396 [Aspergillus karnatakaensis]|uniref:uncharacterized protein n=1 Tax=Aspergillus karnatakaensis TaxID=1810916 RepID=UPI003CCCDA0C
MRYPLPAEEIDPPLLRAAANPDPDLLEAILAADGKNDDTPSYEQWLITDLSLNGYSVRDLHGSISPRNAAHIYRYPIRSATEGGFAENVGVLLAAGADPNGLEPAHLVDYSIRFIRGRRARAMVEVRKEAGITDQVCPLTEAELRERRCWFPTFWTECNLPSQRRPLAPPLTALEIAAKEGNPEILDLLRAAGADESAWLQSAALNSCSVFSISDKNVPVSVLSTPSPVHEAVAAGHRSMLCHLLYTCEYSPNYRPHAAPTVALPPLSYAIARCNLKESGVQSCIVKLLSHPAVDINLRTPIFEVHLLHFATAHHDPDLLTWLSRFVPGGLRAAGVTALGHTLLHIASLPLTVSQIISRSPPVVQKFVTAEEMAGKNPEPMTIYQQQVQLATIRTLLDGGVTDVCAQDLDGNTCLHYLAGRLNMSEETVELVRQSENGEKVWQETQNIWGFTPRELWGE